MSDYSNVIQGMFGTDPATDVTANINANPDGAARSIELSRSTGVPPSIINTDVESFEGQHKAAMASSMVSNNAYIADYVSSHPLASSVSNDDYGNLDTVSQGLSTLHRTHQLISAPFQSLFDAGKAVAHSYANAFTNAGTRLSDDELKNHRLRSSLAATLDTAVGLGQATLNLPFDLAGGYAKGMGTAITGTKAGGETAEYHTRGILDAAMMTSLGMHIPHGTPSADAWQKALPYLKEGELPPAGLHPLIDEMKISSNQTALEMLKQKVDEAQQSTTKERAPELFQSFIQQHVGDTNIGISGQRVLEMYGDKAPLADDGMLGWVPNIEKQLAVARDTGADISVPMADWIARVDPAVAKDLHDDLRVVREGITNNESKDLAEARTTQQAITQQLQFKGEPLPTHGLVPANMAPDGSIYVGKPNGMHFLISEEHGQTVREQHGLKPGDSTWKEQGFINPKGEFMNRQEAFDWVNKNEKQIRPSENMQGELDALDYREQVPENKRSGTLSTPAIDEAVPVARQAAGLEPMFSIGDRKLQLQRLQPEGEVNPAFKDFHDFDLMNEQGQSVGTINLSEQKGGKELYIEMINGIGEYYNPNKFGPALMRDLLRQIKQEFPEAETLTGHRVTGARDAVGDISGASAMPKIRLSEGWDVIDAAPKFSELMNGAWAPLHSRTGLEAYFKPSELFAEHEKELTAAVQSELARIAPHVKSAAVSELNATGRKVQGAYLQYPDQKSLIVWAMNVEDSLGVARHEAIHHLYREGFFTPEEWSTLNKAAHTEDWLGRYDIHSRYRDLDEAGKFEEGIADAYKTWVEEHETRQRAENYAATPIDRIFQKLKDLFDGIREKLGQILGREPTFEDLFQKVHEGEIGSREPVGAQTGFGVARSETPIVDTGLNPAMPFRNAKDVGMTIDQYRRYTKLIEERQQADLKASSDRVLREQTKRQTKEWKEQSEAMRPKVLEDINSRPDVAADKFFGLGEMFGEKLDKTYRLDWESLTPEQRAMIPESYTVRKGGIKADQVASAFGYQSGDQMLAALGRFVQMRNESGLNRDRFQRQLVTMETQRRMEIEHGFLDKNILEEAHDQILSQNQLDLLHEETHALALMSGEKGFDLTRDQLVSELKGKYDNLLVGQVKSENFLREMGKHGKAAEMSLLQQKPADAFKSKQAQYLNAIYADFARKTEKDLAKLNKTAKPFRKQDVKGIEPEYLNHIQDLLQQGGYKVGRSLDNIQENLERRGGKSLEQFANEKLTESFGYRDIPVADFITDGQLKPVDQLTTWQLGGYKQTVDALVKNARDEQKIIREGEAADRAEVLAEMKSHIERFELKPINATPTMWDKVKEVPRGFIAGMTNMETFLNRMGDRDPRSVFNKFITYPAAAAANRKSALQREFARDYKAIGEIKDKDKLVAAPINDPLTGAPWVGFTRGNVMQMLHNAGNESNWNVLAKGYGADPAALMNWLIANTTKEDWARAQNLGKSVFGKLIKLSDQEYEHIHGVTIDKIPLKPIENAHGTFEGWYHPLVRDPIREGKSPLRDKAYDDSDFGHITTANGYTRKRTGSAYPVDLNPNMTPVRINQMIHDISFRGFVLETQKLFKDSSLSNTITARYGAEYNGKEFLIPWLKSIAGAESVPSRAASKAAQISEYFRQNVISTYIGFNPFTALKHGPTAWVMSMRQVGAGNFLSAVKDMYGRSPDLTMANHEFAMKWSEELQRRERHWQDTIFGAHGEIEGANSLRERVIEKGSWLVAQSDMLSAKPTWLAEYRNGQSKGLSHGESIDLADAAVRQAHGSTAATNQPALVRGGGPLHSWLTSVYGFFGTAMQRRIELAHDINDTYKLAKQGEINKAAANIPSIMNDTFTYVIWPTIIEEWVTGLGTQSDDHKGLLGHLATASLLGLSSSVLYARDIVRGLVSGNDVGVGLISSPLHDIVKAGKDLTRKDAFSKQRAGKTVGDTLAAFGHLSGMAPKTVDNAIHFGIDLVNQQAHPHTAGDWARGVLKGKTEPRKVH